MTTRKLNGADFLLLLFYLPGISENIAEPITGRTRITKMMFIFKKEIFNKLGQNDLTEDDLPDFKPYHYGPFSHDVHEQLDLFTNIGFLDEIVVQFSNANEMDLEEDLRGSDEEDEFDSGSNNINVSRYKLTARGINYVEEKILDYFNQEQLDLLKKYKKQINSSSLDTILSYVYNHYPQYAEKSRIKEKVK